MIQDLTAENDFSNKSNRFGLLGNVVSRLRRDLDTTSPENELVFTGDCHERDTKRFYVDSLTDRSLCDCCGGPLDLIPWHFNNFDKLCVTCNSYFTKEVIYELFENTQQVIGHFDNGEFQLSKPWTIIDREENNAIDNVLLWD